MIGRAFPLPLVGLVALGCAAAGRVGSPAPRPDPSVTVAEEVVRYEVSGGTVADIARSLDAGARTTEEGRFRGTTSWRIGWRYRYEPDRAGCRITEVDVRLDLVTTLPRRTPADAGEPGLARAWRRYLDALRLHEAGHRRYAMEAANEVARGIRRLRTASCDTMEPRADELGRRVVERYRGVNLDYDRRTAHGRAQGAAWPPGETYGGGPR